VGASSREDVKSYIARQEEHHRTRSFKEELMAMLQRADIDFDEAYVC